MSRRAARVAAVEVLYAADIRGANPLDVLGERPDVEDYTEELVREAISKRDELDDLISRHSVGWTLDRMSPVDRNVLRIGTLELLVGDVPAAAVIDEAIDIAKRFSGEEAGRFVNGVLDAVRQELVGSGGGGGAEGGSAGGGGGAGGGGAGAGGAGGAGAGGAGGAGAGGAGGAGAGGAGVGGAGAGPGLGDGAGQGSGRDGGVTTSGDTAGGGGPGTGTGTAGGGEGARRESR